MFVEGAMYPQTRVLPRLVLLCGVAGLAWVTACRQSASDGVARSKAEPQAAGPDALGENMGNTAQQPIDSDTAATDSATSLSYGDPHLAFDLGPQSAEIEKLREEFLESLNLGRQSQTQFYDRMFSEANYRAFYGGLSESIKRAHAKHVNDPGPNDLVTFMTGGGLEVAVSWDQELSSMHISIKQQIRATTHAVCSQFGHFALMMVDENNVRWAVPPHFTDSGVHHLIFLFSSTDEPRIRNYDAARALHVANYQAIQFEYIPTEVPRGCN